MKGSDMKPQEWPKDQDPWNGDLMTVKEWVDCCDSGGFIDYDGMGDLVIETDTVYKIVTEKREGDIFPSYIVPSKRNHIPSNVTHILWYNK